MNRKLKRVWGSRLVALVSILCLFALTAPYAYAEGADPRVIPPNAKPGGLTYGEWNAKWWQWALSLPATNHPLFDQTGENCGVGQEGSVWFLVGVLNETGTAVRDKCVIPEGKKLFIPILNVLCSVATNDGNTRSELRACADELADGITDLAFEVDGVSIPKFEKYRSPSPAFNYGPVPQDNIFGLPAGTTSLAVADGYYIMLAPLSEGRHTIHFHGSVPSFNFTLDITYHLRVDDDD